jgi:hypothetical protein
MVSLVALWLPILLSAVLVLIASSIIHMLLGYHSTDLKRIPAEDAVLDALRPFNLAPGDYAAPRPQNAADTSSPEFKAKLDRGPRVLLTIMSPASRSMARSLVMWFVYLLVVSLFAGYVAGAALGAGTPYLQVFRLTSTVAFAGYVLALWQGLVWYSRDVGYTLKATFDGLVYALLTGGVFGWLWP